MKIVEILCGCENKDLEPSEEEINNIKLDNKVKHKKTAKGLHFTAMPGNQSTYPAF